MKLGLIKILIIYIINITLCISIRYDCDKRNISCGCAFKNVEINEHNNNNGEESIPYSWSMVVSIRYDCNKNGDKFSHCCIGTIINDRYILTAASCFDSRDNSSLISGNITIAASIHSLSQNCQTIRVVDRISIHPKWTQLDDTMYNLAILHLEEPLDFNNDFVISQACLPSRINSSIEMIHNRTLAVIGWNVSNSSENNTNQVLKQLIVYPIDYNDSFCTRSVNNNSQGVFCAGRDGAPCFPKVGDPLFEWSGDRWELVGIETNSMNNCPRIGYKGVFLRISAYKDWIELILNSDNMITSSTEFITTQLQSVYKCNRSISCGCSYSDAEFYSNDSFGGEDVIDQSWSMIVSLRFYGSKIHSCAGTLLSNSFILTAAHCIDHFSSTHPINITIHAGVTNRSDSDGYQRNVDQIYIHPNYTAWPYFLNNIALLHINRPLYSLNNPILAKTCVQRMNSSIIINDQYPKNGTHLVVIGWGALRPGNCILSDYLKQIQVYAIDNQDQICRGAISNSEIQFCASFYNNESDACLGDSGGPVLYWTGDYWEQVGVIGYNFNCGQRGYPGIYTRLSYYWQWMEDILNITKEHLEPQDPSTITTTTTSTRPPITRNTTRRSTTTKSSNFSQETTTILNISHANNTTTSSLLSTSTSTNLLSSTTTTSSTTRLMTTPGNTSVKMTTITNFPWSITTTTTSEQRTTITTRDPPTTTTMGESKDNNHY